MIGEIYRLTDSKPQAYAEILNVTHNVFWDGQEEIFQEEKMAWGNWYIWSDKDVRVMCRAGFEVNRLIKATDEEIAVYRKKVVEHRRAEDEQWL